ncbi:hypothetical protein [Janibacter hoylei]|uniref:hypothetical protein n=1 Tax=Janibacter hoylei TaxID=364298 RepID=UPI000FE4024B|nr:hypothetical protein [Janibacter hoylei]
MSEQIEHREGCRGPEIVVFTGFAGDEVTKCRACHRSVIAGGATPLHPLEYAPSGTRLVCRVHYQPVRPNGSGCKACALENAQQRNRRKKEQP